MRIGTRSLLFGVHQVLIHPWFVAWGWTRLYGWPRDYRLWVAFFVHDLGYWGCSDMDGEVGEAHPTTGAKIMGRLFGVKWFWFTLLHSRFYAKTFWHEPSRLCYADKMAIVLTPWWIYLPLAKLSGELNEYMGHPKYAYEGQKSSNPRVWHREMQQFVERWLSEALNERRDQDA